MAVGVIGGGEPLTYRETLTTAGPFIVPSRVTLLNYRLKGGGGGGGAAGATVTAATAGGATTFDTVSADGGVAGGGMDSSIGSVAGSSGRNASAYTGQPGGGGHVWDNSVEKYLEGSDGADGSVICGYLAVLPGDSITYTIGAGGNGGGVASGAYGGSGGSGYIELEWQV